MALSGAAFALVGVILGALGAHALRDVLDERALNAWETAVLYQLLHGLALLILSVWTRQVGSMWLLRSAAVAFVVGVLLFSGSIYGLTLEGPRWLGPITPIGGVAMIGGWTLLVAAAVKNPS